MLFTNNYLTGQWKSNPEGFVFHPGTIFRSYGAGRIYRLWPRGKAYAPAGDHRDFFTDIPCGPRFLMHCSEEVFRQILNILSTSLDSAFFLEIISDGFVRYGRTKGKKVKKLKFFLRIQRF